MTDPNPLERAAIAASLFHAPPRVYELGTEAAIKLADGTGHLLDGATLTAWGLPDVITGRSE